MLIISRKLSKLGTTTKLYKNSTNVHYLAYLSENKRNSIN